VTETIPHNPVLTNVLIGVLIPVCVLVVVALVIGVVVWVMWYRRSKSRIAEFLPDAVHDAYK
jgi:Flp pilus assembly protein TadB